MTDRPILFSGEMVRAILDGRKTQTRRVIGERYMKPEQRFIQALGDTILGALIGLCPYGQPGDRLWVREAFAGACHYHQTNGLSWRYRADRPGQADPFENGCLDCPHTWNPSIHMPRWACRLMLEVTGVRVERLQAISDDDCWHEGLRLGGRGLGMPGLKSDFQLLWDSINGKRAPWDSNPWVWVVEFRRLPNG